MSSPEQPYCPDVNDIIRINFDPQTGREQSGLRPALVLSPRRYNSIVRLCVVCPITSQVKGYPFEVPIPDGYPVAGVVLADQLKSLSWQARGSVFVCPAPQGVMREVKGKIKSLIALA
jgi:mRNA interferase MazF